MATHSNIVAWKIPWRSLISYSLWSHKESDLTEHMDKDAQSLTCPTFSSRKAATLNSFEKALVGRCFCPGKATDLLRGQASISSQGPWAPVGVCKRLAGEMISSPVVTSSADLHVPCRGLD